MEPASDFLDRIRGCLLGLAIGDAVGAPFEGMPATAIWYDFGGAMNVVANPPVEQLIYTDDTQMCIGVAETLADEGRIVEATLCARFAANYEPDRGYGRGARRILDSLSRGDRDWRDLTQTVFPRGSLGNGAAMRVAPVGVFFQSDLDRVADEATLSAQPTHVHLVGIDGARIMALATALAVRSAGKIFDRTEFYRTLIAYAATEEFRGQLETAAAMTDDASVAILGHGLEAHLSVVTSIACFASNANSYTAAIARAIGLGGDTDTLAAMAGALSGARLGMAAVPAHLIRRLEDRPKGRSYLIKLSERLHKRYMNRDS